MCDKLKFIILFRLIMRHDNAKIILSTYVTKTMVVAGYVYNKIITEVTVYWGCVKIFSCYERNAAKVRKNSLLIHTHAY